MGHNFRQPSNVYTRYKLSARLGRFYTDYAVARAATIRDRRLSAIGRTAVIVGSIVSAALIVLSAV